jgi:predicted O-methyltransferase YrrM
MTTNTRNTSSLAKSPTPKHKSPPAAASFMTTLDQSPVKELLLRLHAEAKQNDSALDAEEHALAAANGGVIDPASLDSIHDRTFMAVAPEVGRLIYLLVRCRRPEMVVEFGASFGISAIHIAAALRDNGCGRMITTELSATKASRTAQHLAEARLSDLVEIRQGDAFETLAGMEKIDLILLDGWKPLYLPMLKRLEPVLSPNCLIIADDVIKLAHEMRPYLDYVRDPANGYVSSEIPLDDGLELSIR